MLLAFECLMAFVRKLLDSSVSSAHTAVVPCSYFPFRSVCNGMIYLHPWWIDIVHSSGNPCIYGTMRLCIQTGHIFVSVVLNNIFLAF